METKTTTTDITWAGQCIINIYQLLWSPSPSGKCKLPFSGSGDFALGQCSNKALSKSAPKFTAKVENVKTERFEFVGYI